MISLELFRKHIRPRHQRFVDLARRYRPAGDDPHLRLQQLGLRRLHRDGHRRRRHAAAGGQGHGARATSRSASAAAWPSTAASPPPARWPTARWTTSSPTCAQTLEIMMPGGGYAFAPTHQLQDNSPTENVLAMYEAARKYGTVTDEPRSISERSGPLINLGNGDKVFPVAKAEESRRLPLRQRSPIKNETSPAALLKRTAGPSRHFEDSAEKDYDGNMNTARIWITALSLLALGKGSSPAAALREGPQPSQAREATMLIDDFSILERCPPSGRSGVPSRTRSWAECRQRPRRSKRSTAARPSTSPARFP